MHKKFSLSVAVFLIISLALCVVHYDAVCADEPAPLKVVTSFYPVYIITKNITRDLKGVSVENLTVTSGCLHDYAITTDDMKRLAGADVFVINGAGMESFLEKVIAQYPRLKIVALSEGIPLIRSGYGTDDNPHVWVSVSNVIIQARNLARALAAYDPGRAGRYSANCDAYVQKLEGLKSEMHNALAQYKGRRIVTFHEAFPYFAKEFDLTIAAVVEREPGSEPGARELADTIEIVRKNGKAVLFSEPQYSAGAADLIARETGAKVYVLDPAVTGPDDYDAYVNIMKQNLDVLKKAFEE